MDAKFFVYFVYFLYILYKILNISKEALNVFESDAFLPQKCVTPVFA